MMKTGLKLGTVAGVPIRIHLSWLFLFGLVAALLAAGYLPQEHPGLSPFAYWLLGASASLLLSGSVLAHELGHVLAALYHRILTRGITLFLFGGIAEIEGQPSTPKLEFYLALAGPLISLGLAGMFAGIGTLTQPIPYVAILSSWLARLNLLLALFNLVPGLPLDGGRMLRAAAWHFLGDAGRATRIAVLAGRAVAFGLVAGGALVLTRGNLADGVWLSAIGLFLYHSGGLARTQERLQRWLQETTVAQVIATRRSRRPGRPVLGTLMTEQDLDDSRPYFLARGGGLRRADNGRPGDGDPGQRLIWVGPGTPLAGVLHSMDATGVGQVLVVEERQVLAVLTREEIWAMLSARYRRRARESAHGPQSRLCGPTQNATPADTAD